MAKTPGQQIIESLESFIQDCKDGKPVKQTIMRRMKVKGKIVFVRESFKAPMKKPQ